MARDVAPALSDAGKTAKLAASTRCRLTLDSRHLRGKTSPYTREHSEIIKAQFTFAIDTPQCCRAIYNLAAQMLPVEIQDGIRGRKLRLPPRNRTRGVLGTIEDKSRSCLGEDDEKTNYTIDLHALPAEIRLLIFRAALASSWRGRTPPLIAALRPDTVLYYEALGEFRVTNRLAITPLNDREIGAMSSQALGDVRRAAVYDGWVFHSLARLRLYGEVANRVPGGRTSIKATGGCVTASSKRRQRPVGCGTYVP